MVGLTPEPAEELGEGRGGKEGEEACQVLTNLFSSGDKLWAEKK